MTCTLVSVVGVRVPDTVTGWFWYSPLPVVQENVPDVPVMVTFSRFPVVAVPPIVTLCPTYRPSVDAQENVPEVPVTVTVDSWVFCEPAETTVVPEGMPVPLTACPAPILTWAVAKVTFTVEFRMPVAENTPILDIEVPLMSPISTGVLIVLSIASRFWPGCATKDGTPPVTS